MDGNTENRPTPNHESLDTLMAMLASQGSLPDHRLAALAEPDWAILAGICAQHRLGPMLHWRLKRRGGLDRLPAGIAKRLQNEHRMHVVRALMIQRDLLATAHALAAAGIPMAALKGAFLAHFAYPDPGLRPLRDLDILVPREHALRAFNTLLAAGFERLPERMGEPEAALKTDHHFPPLRAPLGKSIVEVHFGLQHPAREEEKRFDLADDPELWQRLIHMRVADTHIAYLSATDLLLHLCVHAIYDHMLDNGPLVLDDIAMLLKRYAIDWSLFWRLAARGDWTRGCQLLLAMAEMQHGSLSISYPPGIAPQDIPHELMRDALRLMLQDTSHSRETHVWHEAQRARSPFGTLGVVANRLFTSRAYIAKHHKVSAQSAAVWLYYLPHWWRLFTQRVPRILSSRRQSHFKTESHRRAHLSGWLEGGRGQR